MRASVNAFLGIAAGAVRMQKCLLFSQPLRSIGGGLKAVCTSIIVHDAPVQLLDGVQHVLSVWP